MKVNVEGVLNTAQTKQQVSAFYGEEQNRRSIILRMVYAVFLFAAVGTSLSSCGSGSGSNPDPPDMVQAPTCAKFSSMIDDLGLVSVTLNTKSYPAVIGDIVEISFTDVYNEIATSLKLNENESDKSGMTFYGTMGSSNVRCKIKISNEGLSAFFERKKSDGTYTQAGSYGYDSNSDKSVRKFQVKADGTEVTLGTFYPKSINSLNFAPANGASPRAYTDFVIVKK